MVKNYGTHHIVNGSDKQFIDAVTEFYKGNSRSTRHKNFWNKFV